ncbi:hypothetical protein EUX98_g7934 [Antrodiella citrinella]|uniref:Uncharacterized protein n=1 Tax=Antrodiella citrinella TaxID=2447956 RepID=A0A4S4MCL5_9APHY|nr:hypothetical protein EUX98_g7934 [Antrodiella citrinella]
MALLVPIRGFFGSLMTDRGHKGNCKKFRPVSLPDAKVKAVATSEDKGEPESVAEVEKAGPETELKEITGSSAQGISLTVTAARDRPPVDPAATPDPGRLSAPGSAAPKKMEQKTAPIEVQNVNFKRGVSPAEFTTAAREVIEKLIQDDLSDLAGRKPLAVNDLLIPRLIVEHKKPGASESEREDLVDQAFGQCYMSCVSIVRFLTQFNIWEEPIYGLVTTGTLGTVFSVFASKQTENIYVVEQGSRTYDISNPADVFHLAVILVRIRNSCKSLQDNPAFALEEGQTEGAFKFKSTDTQKILTTLSNKTEHDLAPLLWTKESQKEIHKESWKKAQEAAEKKAEKKATQEKAAAEKAEKKKDKKSQKSKSPAGSEAQTGDTGNSKGVDDPDPVQTHRDRSTTVASGSSSAAVDPPAPGPRKSTRERHPPKPW